jgi:hypothetical protein
MGHDREPPFKVLRDRGQPPSVLAMCLGIVAGFAGLIALAGCGSAPGERSGGSGQPRDASMRPSAPRVSHGPTGGVRVPNVIRWSPTEASCKLVSAGLRWRIQDETSVHRLAGGLCDGSLPQPADSRYVVAQRPLAGQRLQPRGVVVLWVEGPTATEVQEPGGNVVTYP